MNLESLIRRLALVALAFAAACSRAAPVPASKPAAEDPAPVAGALRSGLLPLDAKGRPHPPEAEFEIEGAPIEYRQRAEFHDFGLVPLGEVAEHTWTLQNTDEVAIRLHKLSPSCSCTTVRAQLLDANGAVVETPSVAPDLLEIPAQAKIQLVVQMDTREVRVKNADKFVMIQLITSSANRPYVTLEAHIVADSPLQLNPEGLELGRVPASVGAQAKVDLVPVGPTGTVPLEIGPVPAGFEATLERRDVLGRDVWTLTLIAQPPVAAGPLRGAIEVRTRKPKELPPPGQRVLDNPNIEWVPGLAYTIRFAGQGIGDLDVFPVQLVAVGTRANGGSGESVLSSLLAGQRLRVTGTKLVLPGGIATHGELELHATPVDPDDGGRSAQWRLELVAPPDFAPQQLAGTAVIELDDAQFPRYEVPFLVRLQ
ncbi:MAG: DUF1573 domain-containing protein [Planctomycetota bacterium]|nr:MAG: DUF1573 domain-containing protein [Planctomycetota bacterium]